MNKKYNKYNKKKFFVWVNIEKVINYIKVIIGKIKNWVFLSLILKLLLILSFITLFFYAEYNGKLNYLYYRIIIFIILIIKLYYYFICLPIFENNIKEYFEKNRKINRLGLILLKWTNLIYIYNDILIIIIKFMSILRYYVNKLSEGNKKKFQKVDLLLYKIFFVIIKEYIIELVLRLKKIKKRLIESEIKNYIKKRLIIWVIITYILIYFLITFNIKFMLIIYLIYIGIRSYKKIKIEIEKVNIVEKYDNIDSYYDGIFYIIKKDSIYDELIETDYILRNCVYEDDYEIEKIRMYATKKQVDSEVVKELRMYNENYYGYQYNLYYKESYKKKIYCIIIDKVLYLIKINILYIMRIAMELESNKKIKEKEKKFLMEQKYLYEENLRILKEFFIIIEDCKIGYSVQLCDRRMDSYDTAANIIKKKIDIRLNLYNNEKTKLNKDSLEELKKIYIKYYSNFRKIAEKEKKYSYNRQATYLLEYLYVEIMSVDEFAYLSSLERKGEITQEELFEIMDEDEKYNYYIHNFSYYIENYIGKNAWPKNYDKTKINFGGLIKVMKNLTPELGEKIEEKWKKSDSRIKDSLK